MRIPSVVAEVVAFVVAGGLLGCRTSERSEDAGSAAHAVSVAIDADATASPATASNHDAGAPTISRSRPCTVTLSRGGGFHDDPTSWIALEDERQIDVRDHESGRELVVRGPGETVPCNHGVALLARGSAAARPFAGEAPGSEQWVATACGVLRWATGDKHVHGAPTLDACTFEIASGAASAYVASDVIEAVEAGGDGGSLVTPGAFQVVSAKRSVRLVPKKAAKSYFATRGAASVGLADCERAAREVADLAKAMADPDAGSRSDLAERSVTARSLARAACAVAEVRVALTHFAPADVARLERAFSAFREDAHPAGRPDAGAPHRE